MTGAVRAPLTEKITATGGWAGDSLYLSANYAFR